MFKRYNVSRRQIKMFRCFEASIQVKKFFSEKDKNYYFGQKVKDGKNSLKNYFLNFIFDYTL